MKNSKKVILAFALFAVSVMSAQTAAADTIRIKFGSFFGCWMPGICEIVITTNNVNADITYNGAGMAELTILQNEISAEEDELLSSGNLQMDDSYIYSASTAAALGMSPGAHTPAGNYPVAYNPVNSTYTVSVPVL